MGRRAEEVIIRNATILTMNDRMDVVSGAVVVRDARIHSVGDEPPDVHGTIIDATGCFLLPGFIQPHIHLCQTLFRGYADDLRLLDWLRTRVWPMEAAHTPASLRAATRLACHELLTSGTTTVLTMETVHETEAVIEAAAACGIRATIGKCMMDAPPPEAPSRLREPTQRSIDDALGLRRQYDGAFAGRIRTAFAPRFAISCSRDLLEGVAELSARDSTLVHTHASEQRDEIELVKRDTGLSNIGYFEAVGLASPRLCAAHCVWVDEHEQELLRAHDVKVTHCPGSNLKLGSGIAPVNALLQRGVCVSIASDGAACNNRLDMFGEMRLAATLQAVNQRPGAVTARSVLWMATRNGARAMGLDGAIGSIEAGKRADLILIDATTPRLASCPDPFSAIVYAARPDDVTLTMVDGEILVRDRTAVHLDAQEIAITGAAEAKALALRAGL